MLLARWALELDVAHDWLRHATIAGHSVSLTSMLSSLTVPSRLFSAPRPDSCLRGRWLLPSIPFSTVFRLNGRWSYTGISNSTPPGFPSDSLPHLGCRSQAGVVANGSGREGNIGPGSFTRKGAMPPTDQAQRTPPSKPCSRSSAETISLAFFNRYHSSRHRFR